MATAQQFRYSNGQIATHEAASSFSWEAPVPVNRFWDSIDYCTARNFLICFSDAELEQLPIDVDNADDTATKLHLLLTLLKDKISREGEAMLREQDYDKWHALHLALFGLQGVLDLPEAEDTIQLLVTHSKNKFVTQHMMSDYLLKIGKYKEAEEGERTVLEWMENHPKLGRDSPQAINARRILVRALWGQGEDRRTEAQEILEEVERIVEEEMEAGRFAVYREEEGRLNLKMREGLGV